MSTWIYQDVASYLVSKGYSQPEAIDFNLERNAAVEVLLVCSDKENSFLNKIEN